MEMVMGNVYVMMDTMMTVKINYASSVRAFGM